MSEVRSLNTLGVEGPDCTGIWVHGEWEHGMGTLGIGDSRVHGEELFESCYPLGEQMEDRGNDALRREPSPFFRFRA